ncbi:MAG TPA: UDP-N-acetylenolpyruvoylglucosamine reductase [Lachnospiraceae bacterium]|nr:UDP-N-acetylenolpyruvoylglucosamine reductase [Lachnospiraceae bacterium]
MIVNIEQFKPCLEQIVGTEALMEHEPMNRHTTFRIGGPARYFVTPRSPEQVQRVLSACRQEDIPWFILGNGSNLLVSDRGYGGVVVRIGSNLGAVEVAGERIRAQAGALLSQTAHAALAHDLTGMEFAAGIPGTLGGACLMNAGAYGGEMRQILISVTALDADGEICEIPADELEMGYRTSLLMKRGYVVLGAGLQLAHGDAEQIKARMEVLKNLRVQKQPLECPSAGSTFKRPEGCFAGKLIMDAGLRGYRVGGAQVSEKHCGFVINAGGATAEDVCRLIGDVHRIVYEKFGKELEPEVRFLGFDA